MFDYGYELFEAKEPKCMHYQLVSYEKAREYLEASGYTGEIPFADVCPDCSAKVKDMELVNLLHLMQILGEDLNARSS